MSSKHFNDSIHGLIELSNTAVSIIDTQEFQRLRKIKQLGTCSFVFQTGTHSRFEHSLGTAYLARKLATLLKINQPELGINDIDIQRVEIAGLCHDLGHGPWSHVFDDEFIKTHKNVNKIKYKTHEERSIEILKLIIRKYNIDLDATDISVITDMINPPNEKINDLSFLYTIVSNKRNGIDVDKFDYIARDTYHINLDFSYNYTRIFEKCKVIDNQICYPLKDSYNVYAMFNTRYRLHKQIYNHPVVKSIEYMIVDYLKLYDIEFNLIEKINNLEHFCKLSDNMLNIFDTGIISLDSENLKKMNQIIVQIETRKIYKHVLDINTNICNDVEDVIKKLKENNIDPNDLIINKLTIGLGSNDVHPIEKVNFYDKSNNENSFNVKIGCVSNLITEQFNESVIRIFTRDARSNSLKKIKHEVKNTFK